MDTTSSPEQKNQKKTKTNKTFELNNNIIKTIKSKYIMV